MSTCTETRYPEHEKLSEVSAESQTIGEFLDLGLPQMGIVLYEERPYDCECSACDRGEGEFSKWHSDEERETIVNGRVQLRKMFPTGRTIQQILAAYFEIDQDRIDAEKEQMLAALRGEPQS